MYKHAKQSESHNSLIIARGWLIGEKERSKEGRRKEGRKAAGKEKGEQASKQASKQADKQANKQPKGGAQKKTYTQDKRAEGTEREMGEREGERRGEEKRATSEGEAMTARRRSIRSVARKGVTRHW